MGEIGKKTSELDEYSTLTIRPATMYGHETTDRKTRVSDLSSQLTIKPKILVLCPDLPFPIVAGGQMRMASFIEAMSRFAYVHVACVAEAVPESTLSWCKGLGITLDVVNAMPRSRIKKWFERLKLILRRDNIKYGKAQQRRFNEVYENTCPNLVWLETPYLIRYALAWKEKVPLVVDYWGTSEGPARALSIASGYKKIIAYMNWWTAKGGELRYTPMIGDIVCVSQRDALYFRKIAPKSRIHPIPNGIVKPVEDHIPQGGAGADKNSQVMILTGDLSFQPNIDAGIYFAEYIFPRIRRKCPEAQFKLVGRNPSPEILALKKHPGVTVTGWVPDLGREIALATIYVLPLRLGSGFRSKLLDVFPLGKAIVTTSVGKEGIALNNRENCVVADTQVEFADACVELLRHPEERDRLGAAARRLATEVYTQENITSMIYQAVVKVV